MNKLNPLALLDSILADWASPRVRRLVHGVLLLLVVILSLWLAAGGDWLAFAGALAAAVYAGSNHANTPPVSGNQPPEPDYRLF